jgi:type II secretory pathway component GspD/PulD (secretin)
VDIREALSAIAMEREINIAAAPDVSGEISVHLFGVTLAEALDAICMAGGFAYYKHGDLYYVSKPKEAKEVEPEKSKVEIFTLNYADVSKVQEILSALPDMRMVKLHEPTKTIIVEDTQANIARVRTIINYWDRAPKQVLIEAKILEINLTDDMSLGVDWDKILGDVRFGTGGFSRAILPTTEKVTPVPDTGTGIFGNMITGAGTSHQFAAALDALRTKTKVNALSTPKVLAIHGKPAKVQVGGEQGYKVTTVSDGISTETIEFIDTGIVLEITPYIDDEGNVLLNVRPSITSAVLEEGIPVTNTALVTTWLLAKNGETVFIGGLIQNTKTNIRDSVPCLGNIPALGLLFGSTFRGVDKSEIVVLITPQIVDKGLAPPAEHAMEKAKMLEKMFEKEPLPHREQLREFYRSTYDQ